MRKIITRIIAWTVCIALISVGLYFLCAVYGNPVSSALAQSTAKKHLQETYSGTDFEIERIGYDLKTGGYYAKVMSPSSQDSYFTIYTDGLGRFKYDTFHRIADGTNTFTRLNDEYWSLVKSALPPDHLNTDMHFGELRTTGLFEIFDYVNEDGQRIYYTLTKDYGLDVTDLVLDGEYDIHQLGRDHGSIHVNIYDRNVTVERAAELLLEIKTYLDDQDIPFHAIDFDLYEPRNADGQLMGDSISLDDFLYSDIYEEGLTDRVAEAWNITQEHHAIQDALKKEAELLIPYFIELPEDVN